MSSIMIIIIIALSVCGICFSDCTTRWIVALSGMESEMEKNVVEGRKRGMQAGKIELGVTERLNGSEREKEDDSLQEESKSK